MVQRELHFRYKICMRFILTLLLFSSSAILAAEPNGVHPGSPPEPKPMKTPEALRENLQEFRKKALEHDGVFAPDIAFSFRMCPHCNNWYVCGTYPRLRRQPFNDLQDVKEVIETALTMPAPKTMYSPKWGRNIVRSCPICFEPESARRAERVL